MLDRERKIRVSIVQSRGLIEGKNRNERRGPYHLTARPSLSAKGVLVPMFVSSPETKPYWEQIVKPWIESELKSASLSITPVQYIMGIQETRDRKNSRPPYTFSVDSFGLDLDLSNDEDVLRWCIILHHRLYVGDSQEGKLLHMHDFKAENRKKITRAEKLAQAFSHYGLKDTVYMDALFEVFTNKAFLTADDDSSLAKKAAISQLIEKDPGKYLDTIEDPKLNYQYRIAAMFKYGILRRERNAYAVYGEGKNAIRYFSESDLFNALENPENADLMNEIENKLKEKGWVSVLLNEHVPNQPKKGPGRPPKID